MRRDGITKSSTYRSPLVALQRHTCHGTSLCHCNTSWCHSVGRHQTLPRRKSASIRAADGYATVAERLGSFCSTSTGNLSLLRIPTLASVADLIAPSYTVPHARTSSTVCFLHAPRHDYLADERIVHAQCIRKRTGWAKKVGKKKKTTTARA